MDDLLGARLGVYLGIMVVMMGGAAFLTGQAVALIWRPARQIAAYSVLLVFTGRFLIFALFDGDPLAVPGLFIDYALMTGLAWSAHRLTVVTKMVNQYPWLYERTGPWSFREKSTGAG